MMPHGMMTQQGMMMQQQGMMPQGMMMGGGMAPQGKDQMLSIRAFWTEFWLYCSIFFPKKVQELACI